MSTDTPSPAFWYEDPDFCSAVAVLRISTAADIAPYDKNDWHVGFALERMQVVEQHILDHQGPLEPPDYKALNASSPDPLLTSLGTCWLLKRECWELRPEVGRRMLALMCLAHSKGAQLNARSHSGMPVLFAVALDKRHTAPVVNLLLELGADLWPAPMDAAALVELCVRNSGPEGAASVSETLMRRRLTAEALGETSAEPHDVYVAPPRRRLTSL